MAARSASTDKCKIPIPAIKPALTVSAIKALCSSAKRTKRSSMPASIASLEVRAAVLVDSVRNLWMVSMRAPRALFNEPGIGTLPTCSQSSSGTEAIMASHTWACCHELRTASKSATFGSVRVAFNPSLARASLACMFRTNLDTFVLTERVTPLRVSSSVVASRGLISSRCGLQSLVPVVAKRVQRCPALVNLMQRCRGTPAGLSCMPGLFLLLAITCPLFSAIAQCGAQPNGAPLLHGNFITHHGQSLLCCPSSLHCLSSQSTSYSHFHLGSCPSSRSSRCIPLLDLEVGSLFYRANLILTVLFY